MVADFLVQFDKSLTESLQKGVKNKTTVKVSLLIRITFSCNLLSYIYVALGEADTSSGSPLDLQTV